MLCRAGNVALALLLAGLVIQQTRSLYVFPQPDAMRWDGDETWLMREFQGQSEHGALQDPDAPLSSMEHGNGLLLNSSWINAALYGLPAALLFPEYSLVHIGRSITFLLSLFLIIYAYYLLRRYQVPAWLALSSCLIIVGSRAFFYASHSARYDLLTALGVLLLLDGLTRVLERLRSKRVLSSSQRALLVLLPALCLAWTIHLPRIAAIPYFITLAIISRASWKMTALLLAANVVIVALLMLPGYFALGHWTLFPPHPRNSEFVLAFSNIPMLHVFSTAVLRSTFVERFVGLKREAPIATMVAILSLGTGILALLLRRSKMPAGVGNMLIVLALLVFSWAISARFVSFYGIYILPVLVIGGAIVYHRMSAPSQPVLRSAMAAGYVLVAMAASLLAIRDAAIAQDRGNAIVTSLQAATAQALAKIDSLEPHSHPTVLATLQLQDFLQRSPDVRCINSLYREYPADSTPPLSQFIREQHVNFVLMETKELNLSEFNAGCHVSSVASFRGTFDDWGYDYFDRTPRPQDTLVLLRVLDGPA